MTLAQGDPDFNALQLQIKMSVSPSVRLSVSQSVIFLNDLSLFL